MLTGIGFGRLMELAMACRVFALKAADRAIPMSMELVVRNGEAGTTVAVVVKNKEKRQNLKLKKSQKNYLFQMLTWLANGQRNRKPRFW
jgi:hypothetical protein